MELTFRNVILLLTFTLALPNLSLKAQDWEALASLGLSGYIGEYNPGNILKINSFTLDGGAKYNFNPTWGIRGSLAVIGVNGKANYTVNPGLPVIAPDEAFKSKTLVEISILPEFNFFKFEPNQSKNVMTPYIFAGVGGVLFPREKQRVGQRKTTKTSLKPVIPFGAGFKYNLKGSLSINSFISYRIAGTGSLDNYLAPMPRKDSGGVRFLDKVNSTDKYTTFQIGITYTFFKEGCPIW